MPSLADVEREASSCTRCPLASGRTQVVFGVGDPTADLMFVGEGPGAQEDLQGEPFVGRSGQLLDRLMQEELGFGRDRCYIANVVKCRPPGNRDPLPDEIAACEPWLARQIEIIDPDVIVTLGRFSMAQWFPGERISRIHGQPKRVGHRLVVPMYHPAAALHQQALKATIQEDFSRLPKILAEAEAVKRDEESSSEPPAQQMGLF